MLEAAKDFCHFCRGPSDLILLGFRSVFGSVDTFVLARLLALRAQSRPSQHPLLESVYRVHVLYAHQKYSPHAIHPRCGPASVRRWMGSRLKDARSLSAVVLERLPFANLGEGPFARVSYVPGFSLDLVSATMSFCRNDMSVYMLVSMI